MALSKGLSSMKVKKAPKTPKMSASTKSWDSYQIKLKEVNAHNAKIDAEKKRREKIKAMKK